jgi:hypothetical protein
LVTIYFVALCSHLKKNHNTLWVSLGEPSLWNQSPRNNARLQRFIWRDYRDVQDPKLRTYVLIVKILYASIAFIFVALMAVSWFHIK